MKGEILRRLREADGYVSGQELCESLGVSRTAVWKVIRQLEEDGYEIEAVRNRGYRLSGSPDVLSEEELKASLETKWAGKQIVLLDQVDSTNTEARRRGEQGAPHGTLILTELQTAGKGRRGRSWSSPAGSNVSMSLLLRPDFAPVHASVLTLVAAMAVEQGIREVTGLSCQIKWPNDIVLNGKKLCGILTEMSTEEDCIRHLVVGIGINANIRQFPEELCATATSLCLELGQPVRRADLVNRVLCAWEYYYDRFLETLDMSGLLEEYNSRLVNLDRQVTVHGPSGSWQGMSRGIDREGQLLVETEDGCLQTVMSGELAVRGIYGYV